MRIIGGSARGLKLADVGEGDAQAHLRPTSDRVREAIFNLLINGGHGDPVTGARVLDLFAGTGALGLEALSRGAAQCLFAEQDRDALDILRKNLGALDAVSRADIRAGSVMALGPAKRTYDLLMLDAPYDTGAGSVALDKLNRLGWIGADSLVSIETSEKEVVDVAGFEIDAERKVGKAKLTLLRLL